MRKADLILIFLILALMAGVGFLYQTNQSLRENNARLAENQAQVMSDNAQWKRLVLSQEEFNKMLTYQVDSLLKALKIAPKQVTRVIERHHYHTDTVTKYYPLEPVGEVYPFLDVSTCFTFGGSIAIEAGEPLLKVDRREYNNETTDVFYWERPHKFLFIRWGKKEYKHEVRSKCGTDEVKEIEVLKK